MAPDLAHSIDENGSLVTVPPADWIVCFVPGLKKQWWHRFCNRDHKHVFALRPMETGSWVLVEPWWTRLMVTVLPSSDAVRFLRWGAAGDMVRLREAVPGRGNQLKGWFNCAVMVGFLLGRSSWVWTPHALYKQLVSETGVEHEDVESLLVEHFRKVLDRNMRRALSLDARIARHSTAEILTELARNILSLIMSREIIDLHHTAIIEAELVCLGKTGPILEREPIVAKELEKVMGRQRFTPEQIIAKLREADVLVGRGSTAVEACRQIGISEQTLYRWRKEYGGLKVDQARRMKDLERENARLKRLVADLALDKAILQEASKLTF